MQPVGNASEAEPDEVQRYQAYAYVGAGTPVQVPVVALRVVGILVEPLIVGGSETTGYTIETTGTPLIVAPQPVADGNRNTAVRSGFS